MAKLTRDEVDRYHDYDVHVPTRTVYVGSIHASDDGESGVDSSMAERAIKNLHILDNAAPAGDKPITIIMNNPGGDFYHGLAIYDAIKACNNHVTVIATGYCMSMGAVIMQAADERILTSNCRVMIHYGYTGLPMDHAITNETWSDQHKKDKSVMVDILFDRMVTKNPNLKRKEVKKLLTFDTILFAQEAVNLGLADKIQ